MDTKGSNSITMNLHGVSNLLMGIEITARASVEQQYRITLFDCTIKKHIYEGNLQQTIELILLGKVLKDQLQKIDKAEPVAPCTS